MSVYTLSGRRVLVMGGSSGIGCGVAQLAYELGADTTIASRSPERLAAARRTIGTVDVSPVDLTDAQAVARFFATHDPFDHVVVSAADLKAGSLRGLDLADSRAAMESKFWTAVHVAREACITPNGSLTLVSGILSRKPSPEATVLTAINAAVEALAQALALELSPVRVNCVSPGHVDTEWWDRLPPDERKDLLDRAAARLPVNRVGRPEDIAIQVIACMLNEFMTGTVVAVDGGASIA
jgi:NAD(P)-dependent dehydrogenase (short-subunit alcohol dehydrogenase family)